MTPDTPKPAKSLIAIMALGVRQGDLVRIRACGPDAARAVQELAALIASGVALVTGLPAYYFFDKKNRTAADGN